MTRWWWIVPALLGGLTGLALGAWFWSVVIAYV